jgi:hypothetical protein
MAAHMVSIARREYNADWSYADAASSSSSGVGGHSRQQREASEAGAAEREMQPAPLRSGVATMEPNEGGRGLPAALTPCCCYIREPSLPVSTALILQHQQALAQVASTVSDSAPGILHTDGLF